MKRLIYPTYIICFLIFSLGLAELFYRYQVVDLYSSELRTLNSCYQKSDGKNIVVMGDSFSVSPDSWVEYLRKNMLDYAVINAGITGSGILQILAEAPRRFKEYRPEIFIYQIYVGNDLYDIRKPINWKTLSLTRNLYHFLGNHFQFLTYLNYRLGQLFSGISRKPTILEKPKAVTSKDGFIKENYAWRVRLMMEAEPALIDDTIMVKGERAQDYLQLLCKLNKLLTYLPKDCRIYFLVIPHCCQVSYYYLNNIVSLGATFTDRAKILDDENPFISQLKINFPKVIVLNPLPVFKQQEMKWHLYYNNDEHLSTQGQMVLGEFVHEKLNECVEFSGR